MYKKNLSIIPMLLLAIVLSACNAASMGNAQYASIPAGKAYSEGQEIYFIHTETSDADTAQKLTDMMKSPVLVVPSLADVPAAALADVYVFENGLKGAGPLGYQLDVFDAPPNAAQGYTPLRRLIVVKWHEDGQVRELKSETEILAAQDAAELTANPTDVVINMPFVTWPGGKR